MTKGTTTTTKNISLGISFPARDKGNYCVCPGFEGIASTKGSGPRLASITAILIPPHGRNLSFSVQIAALPIALLEHVSTPSVSIPRRSSFWSNDRPRVTAQSFRSIRGGVTEYVLHVDAQDTHNETVRQS